MNNRIKEFVKRIPILGDILRQVRRRLAASDRPRPGQTEFPGSEIYWEQRYAAGGTSGAGSYGEFAKFKAEILNAFVAEKGVKSVIEFGCGDGNQLTLAEYPSYLGFDISEAAVNACRKRFEGDPTKAFDVIPRYGGQQADLAVSLDVVYHLVEDEIFDEYMRKLFIASKQYVVVYSSDTDDNRGFDGTHVKHRRFSSWIKRNLPGWRLIKHIPNRYPYRGDHRTGSFAEFFFYERA